MQNQTKEGKKQQADGSKLNDLKCWRRLIKFRLIQLQSCEIEMLRWILKIESSISACADARSHVEELIVPHHAVCRYIIYS